MFINPITVAMGAINLLSDITSHHANKDKDKAKDSLTQAGQADSLNVNNMSFNDLNAMSLNLMQDGRLSDGDGQNFLKQINSIQQTSGIAKDAKIDMVQLYQQQVQNAGSTVDNKDLVALERSLDLLKGIQARSSATIPRSV